MSHPYTDEFGYPLTSTQALVRIRSKQPMHTEAVKLAGLSRKIKKEDTPRNPT